MRHFNSLTNIRKALQVSTSGLQRGRGGGCPQSHGIVVGWWNYRYHGYVVMIFQLSLAHWSTLVSTTQAFWLDQLSTLSNANQRGSQQQPPHDIDHNVCRIRQGAHRGSMFV
jgi:hypothetical protein